MPEGPIVDPLSPAGYAEGAARSKAEQRKRPGNLVDPCVLMSRPLVGSLSSDLYVPVSAASYANAWSAIAPMVSRLGLYVSVPWRITDGSTGDIRVSNGTQTSSGIHVAGVATGIATFKWAHQVTLWTVATFIVQAQRATGAGVVEIGTPTIALVPPVGYKTTGL